ncbi:MAG: nucleotide exchange factor GrpE [Rhodocyclaceae bacterium]|nr:nucleotide exchange factor GrpE [Rhodocyclaceae bacterium]
MQEASQEQTLAQPVAEESAAASVAAEAAAPVAEAEVMPSPEDLIRVLELKVLEHHDAWLRAKAETDNVRRRAQEDITKAHKYAAEKFAEAMLPVKDSLEAALATGEQTVEALKAGVELTLKQLQSAFEKSKVEEVNPMGEKFDPHRHQAIGVVVAAGEPNHVVTVLQKGYLLNERVLRPALVMVSKQA